MLFAFTSLCAQKKKTYTSLEEALKNPSQVYHLRLAHKKLTSLPATIARLVNLEELDLNNNKLTSLPPEVCTLTHLKELNVFRNKLTALPSEIGNLKELHRHLGAKNLVAVGIYMLSIPAAFVSTWLALGLIMLPAVMYFIPDPRIERSHIEGRL